MQNGTEQIDYAASLATSLSIADGATAYSLASGHAGYSLMFTHVARHLEYNSAPSVEVRRSYDLAERHLLEAATAWKESSIRAVGLFEGVAGYIFALGAYEESTTGATPKAKKMAQNLLSSLDDLYGSGRENGAYSQHEFDVISGIAGAMSVCATYASPQDCLSLRRRLWRQFQIPSEGPEFSFAFQKENSPSEVLRIAHPNGYLDLGLAHGLSGIAARLTKQDSPRGELAAARMGRGMTLEWLWRQIATGYGDGAWDPRGSYERQRELRASDLLWCYGRFSAGVALQGSRAEGGISGAAEELEVELVRQVARSDVESLLNDVVASRSFGVCHGLSGALMTLSLWPGVNEDARSLETIVFEYSRVLGGVLEGGFPFSDLGPATNCVKSGFLNGAVGALMARLALGLPKSHKNNQDFKLLMFG